MEKEDTKVNMCKKRKKRVGTEKKNSCKKKKKKEKRGKRLRNAKKRIESES